MIDHHAEEIRKYKASNLRSPGAMIRLAGNRDKSSKKELERAPTLLTQNMERAPIPCMSAKMETAPTFSKIDAPWDWRWFPGEKHLCDEWFSLARKICQARCATWILAHAKKEPLHWMTWCYKTHHGTMLLDPLHLWRVASMQLYLGSLLHREMLLHHRSQSHSHGSSFASRQKLPLCLLLIGMQCLAIYFKVQL